MVFFVFMGIWFRIFFVLFIRVMSDFDNDGYVEFIDGDLFINLRSVVLC